jgi:hypothetical protein
MFIYEFVERHEKDIIRGLQLESNTLSVQNQKVLPL